MIAHSQTGEWIPHPNYEEGDASTFELVVAGRELDNGDVAIMMVEAGGTAKSFEYYADGAPKVDEKVLAGGLEACKVWIKESIALAQGIMENQSSGFAFIRDMTSKTEMEAAQGSLRQRFGGTAAKPDRGTLQQAALEQVRASISILSGKASKEESDAYSKLLYGLADTVANAATEGGFLGFGGRRVSAGEQSFLDQLRDTLHLERVSKA